MREHGANQPNPSLTEAELRHLHDLAHDPCPEQPEHERLAPPRSQPKRDGGAS